MKPYNVEIFNQDFDLVHHTNVSEVEYKFDYLSPGTNQTTLIYNAAVSTNNYIRIYRDNEEYFGRITGISYTDARHLVMGIDYQPFEQLFNNTVVFDTATQGTLSLETVIANMITANWINNADSEQNVPGLTVSAETSTADWSFYIEPEDPEVQTLVTVNLYTDILVPALTRYQIGVYIDISIPDQTITVHIKRQSDEPYYIESDLPSVITKNIIINEISDTTNKLVVYNKGDLTDDRIYFRHPAGSYDQIDTDRIVPVVYKTQTVSVKTPGQYEEAKQREYESAVKAIERVNKKEEALDDKDRESVQQAVDSLNEVPNISLSIGSNGKVLNWNESTYESRVNSYVGSYSFTEYCRGLTAAEMQEKSDEQAARLFGAIKYNNLIELSVLNEDTLVRPEEMEIGQLVNIISNGISYASILTAKSISKTTTLTFGTLRLDLTKILKARNANG